MFATKSIGTLLVVVFVVRGLVAVFAPVLAQEAYYAEYAAHPALSYLDHPPLVAWSIAVGRSVFGANAWGLRFAAWAWTLGTVLLGISLLRRWEVGESAQRTWIWSAVAVPLFAVQTTLAMTESSLLFFWMLAMWALWRARGGGLGWWGLVGLGVGGACLSKYTAVFLAGGVGLAFLFDSSLRRQFGGALIAAVVGALCVTPILRWNASHEWASFAFQFADRVVESRAVTRWIAQLVFGQFGLLGPFVFAALIGAALWWLRRWRHDPRALWVLAFGLPLPLYMISRSPWMHIKLNWLMPAYLALGFGALVWLGRPESAVGPRLRRFARAFFAFAVVLFALLPAAHFVRWSWGNSWSGWGEVAGHVERWGEVLQAERGESNAVFFFAESHKDASLLAWSLRGSNHESAAAVPVLAGNVLGRSALAFDYWVPPTDCLGNDAVFVRRERPRRDLAQLPDDVRVRFGATQFVETVDVQRAGITVQRVSVWLCWNYRGPDRAAL